VKIEEMVVCGLSSLFGLDSGCFSQKFATGGDCWIFVRWLQFFLKQIFTSDMEHDVPTSRHGFCVFCTLPYFAHAFVYLRKSRLH